MTKIRQLNWSKELSLSDLLIKISQASLPGVALIGVTIGLVGSLHCIGMCGAFATTCAQKKNHLVSYHFGKITSYSLLGLLTGFLGAGFTNLVEDPNFKIIPTVILGAFFIYLGVKSLFFQDKQGIKLPKLLQNFIEKRLGSVYRLPQGNTRSFFVGLLSAFLPCGLLYSTLFAFAALQSPLFGFVGMAAFSIGTIPALTFAPHLILKVFKPIKQSWPKISSFALISLGLITISYRMVMTYGQASCH